MYCKFSFLAVLLFVFALTSSVFGFSGSLVEVSSAPTNTVLDQENVWKTLKFDVEHYDVAPSGLQWHDDEILEERLTVWERTFEDEDGNTFREWPKYVRLCSSIIFSNEDDNAGQRMVRFLKNEGAFAGGIANDVIATVGIEVVHGCSAVVETEPGDYFDLRVIFFSPAVNVMNVLPNEGWIESWFSIEAIGIETELIGIPE